MRRSDSQASTFLRLSCALLVVACGSQSNPSPTGTQSNPSPTTSTVASVPPSAQPGEPTIPGSAQPSPPPAVGTPGPEPTPDLSAPSSTQLILDALESGALTPEEAAVFRVFAAFGDERLPAEFQSPGQGWDDHLATRDAAGLWNQLSAEQRAQIAPYFIPPIYAGSWADPEATSRTAGQLAMTGQGAAALPLTAAVDPTDCASEQLHGQFYVNVPAMGGKVRIWWRNGIETSAAFGSAASALAAQMDAKIWPVLTQLMGREPLSDGSQACFNGEDGALDIYLSDRSLEYGASAQTIAYPGRCTDSPTFIILAEKTVAGGLPFWVVAHEFFHAIQYAYHYAGPCDEFVGMDEATAMWAAEHVYPDQQFEWFRLGGATQFSEWFRKNEDTVYWHQPACGPYCGWPYFASLTKRHGVQKMPDLYEATEAAVSDFQAIEAVTPGGIRGYWPQFVRDLWDDHEAQNVWSEWDPGLWSSFSYELGPGGGPVEVPRPGGGGILTKDSATHWRIAPWAANPCESSSANPNWGFLEQETIGTWLCPLNPNEELPSEATFPLNARVFWLGRQEHELWFADDDWPRYIKINKPGLGVDNDDLSVQGYHQLVDGSWSGPFDWKGKDKIEYCRDEASENVRRIAILYGNSSLPTDVRSIDGNYTVEVRDICPVEYSVTIEYDADYATLADTHWTITGTIHPRDPDEVLAEGQLDGEFVGEGTYTGSKYASPFCPTEANPPPGETASGSGELWMTAFVVEDGGLLEPGLAGGPGIWINILVKDLFSEAPKPSLSEIGGGAPAEGGSFTKTESYEELMLACGDAMTATTKTTVTKIGGD